MNWHKSSWALLLATGLIMGGCSEDPETTSAAPADDDTTTETTTVTLSGVVQTITAAPVAKTGSGPISRYQKTVTAADFSEGTALANAIVIVVDSFGNTQTTTADSQGDFSLGVDDNTGYAIVFINPRTLQVVGSLVTASNTALPGSVLLTADTNLGAVVIDTATGEAVAEADVNNTITVADATAMDADGDGTVSSDDISRLQATTLASGASDNLTNLSIMNFMGDPNTWYISGDSWSEQRDDGAGGTCAASGEEQRFSIGREATVKGPDGVMVQAVRQGSLPYYVNHNDACNSWVMSGYADGTIADGNVTTWGGDVYTALSLGVAPTLAYDWRMGLWGWAEYTYADPVNNVIWRGKMDYDQTSTTAGSIKWEENLPLNIELGVPVTAPQRAESWSDGSGGTCTMTWSESFTVNMAGSNYTDAAGTVLPVVYVQGGMTGSNDNCTPADTSDDIPMNEPFDMYVVAKYGADVEAKDAGGNLLTPQAAFDAGTRMGRIHADAAAPDPLTAPLIITDASPSAATSKLPEMVETNAANRNGWLSWIYKNLKEMDSPDLQQFIGDATDFAFDNLFVEWVENATASGDIYYQAISPMGWNPVTFADQPLIESTTGSTFTISHLGYTLTQSGTYGLTFEWRTWDPTTNMDLPVGTAGVHTSTTLAGDGTVIEGALDSYSVTMDIPALTAFPANSTWVNWYEDPGAVGVWAPYTAASMSLWVKLVDPASNVVMEMPIEWYTVRSASQVVQ